jgi:lipopolysaccharide transport system permease protein
LPRELGDELAPGHSITLRGLLVALDTASRLHRNLTGRGHYGAGIEKKLLRPGSKRDLRHGRLPHRRPESPRRLLCGAICTGAAETAPDLPTPYPAAVTEAMLEADRAARAKTHSAGRLDLLVALTYSDLRARYGRGPWQAVKWLLDPFFATGVYLVLVTFVINRPGADPGLSIACATVPFQLVIASVVNGLGSVQLRHSIVLNTRFDRTLIPLSGVITETIAFASALVLLAAIMGAYRVEPTAAIVWLPVVILMTILVSISIAYPASLFGVWWPDLRVFFISAVRTLFFVAPGLVALAQVPTGAQNWLKLNPLTGIFESFRSVLLYGERPAAWELLYPTAFAVVMLLLFVPLYRSEQRQFAKLVEG